MKSESSFRFTKADGYERYLGPWSSFEDFWLPHLEGQGHAGAYVGSLPPDRQEALRERLRQDLLGTKKAGPFSVRAQAVAVRGIR
jgi:hypothetical protein